jgi:hypothetical protein
MEPGTCCLGDTKLAEIWMNPSPIILVYTKVEAAGSGMAQFAGAEMQV